MGVKSIGLLLGIAVGGVLAFPVVGSASAAKGMPWKFAVDTPAAFEAQAADVRKEMGTNGKYGAISVADRTAVEADLDKIDALVRKRGSADKLNDADQVDLMNAQERINAVLTRNEGNRLICKMEPRTGTNFKVKVCMTAHERDEIRRKSQEAFQDNLMGGSPSQAPGD